MKIKAWLLLSYFMVMILPVIAAFFLFMFINAYNNELKVKEHIEIVKEIDVLKNILTDPELYKLNVNKDIIQKALDTEETVELLSKDGVVIYASSPSATSSFYKYTKEQLYEDLYNLKQGYRSYTYRQPVFDHDELIGFFHVQIPREQWLEGVANRTYLIGGGLIIVFILIYSMVVLLVNRKLHRPLRKIMNDMTKFAAGEEIKESSPNNDEIGDLMRHFYAMRNQIKIARNAIKQEQQAREFLIASVSHDLKTPLTSIKAYTESLIYEEQLDDEERQEYLHVIMEKADFLKTMLDDLLTYTTLHSTAQDMEFVRVEGKEFFEMLISDYDALCKQKGIYLHTYQQVTGAYDVNPNQLIRVVNNLVSNAISHTPSGKRVWLAAVSDGLPEWIFPFVDEGSYLQNKEVGVLLIVQNDGEGITEDLLPYVFEPFYQGSKARSKKHLQGTGLGLSITKQIIEKHGGSVRIFAEKEVGTCVICKLPIATER
ncbi:sensor histidine kinase [Virgibacillus proomii]|uniref:sensor histidine kinase n=1 Tax=Virgibacillus proomii TaxID=84407 RepID=UPI001C10DEEC|nr:HAMP domain-containing sensor histidine kinase [Virgibacillus proomii]MBU5267309.1 HAMP domain-containing histidine kinase [Virgibacillus proomii]